MEQSIEEILGQRGAELRKALEDLRKSEFDYAVSELKLKLKQQGRCVTCTLQLPCSHFAGPEELPEVVLPPKQEFSIHKYTKGLDINALNIEGLAAAHDPSFAVRYREGRNSHVLSTSPRNRRLPPTNRLKALEQIEAFREEKLKKEIERIQQMKVEEEKQQQRKERENKKRLKRTQKLKEQLRKHQEELEKKKASAELEKTEESRRLKAKEDKLRQHQELQKKRVAEHYEKKKVNDLITKQKVDELQTQLLRKDPKTVYLNS